MKIRLLSIFLLFSIISNAQEGYATVGYSPLVSKGNLTHGGYFGAGSIIGKYSVGFNVDINRIGEGDYWVPAIDLRRWVGKYFISLQPGWVLYNKEVNHITVKGGFAATAMVGMKVKFLSFGAGYQNVGFKSQGETDRVGGLKVALGFIVN